MDLAVCHKAVETALPSVDVEVADVVDEPLALEVERGVAENAATGPRSECTQKGVKLPIGMLCHGLQARGSIDVRHRAKPIGSRPEGEEHVRAVDTTPEPSFRFVSQADGCDRSELLALLDHVQSHTCLVKEWGS